MNQQEREELMALLSELIAAQNEVVRISLSKHQGWLDALPQVGVRNKTKDKIMTFVESLTEK